MSAKSVLGLHDLEQRAVKRLRVEVAEAAREAFSRLVVLERHSRLAKPLDLRIDRVAQEAEVVQAFPALLDVLRERRAVVSRLNEFEVAAARGEHGGFDAARGHVALLHQRQAERVAVESVSLLHVADGDANVVDVPDHRGTD